MDSEAARTHNLRVLEDWLNDLVIMTSEQIERLKNDPDWEMVEKPASQAAQEGPQNPAQVSEDLPK